MGGSSTRPWGAALVVALLAVGVVPAGSTPNPNPAQTPTVDAGSVALEYAFRFASAIHADVKDMGKAQASVVHEFASAGLLDDAVKLADEVVGWRQGTVYADLASMLADAGRLDDARRLIPKARSVRESIEGWQTRRIDAHLATALAKLGEPEASARLAGELADVDPRQYGGRSVATIATGLSGRGEFDAAMAQLARLDGRGDREIAWWRTVGYLEIAGSSAITDSQRLAALDAAEISARGVAGWTAAEAMQRVARSYAEFGRKAAAVRLLGEAADRAQTLAGSSPAKHGLLTQIARSYGAVGRARKARGLLSISEREVSETLVIDRPGLLGEIGAAYHAIGDAAASRRVYRSALDAAESLVNARPRALSVVHVCRTMGREGIELTPVARARLDALYAGLRAPW